MVRRFQLCTVLFAWLLATGSHWDLVQTFAWGRMIGNYVRTMPLGDAIRLTFTPDNLCSVCELVQDAKQQQDETTIPGVKLDGKILLVFQPDPQPRIEARAIEPWWWSHDALPVSARATPPLPPPRRSAA